MKRRKFLKTGAILGGSSLLPSSLMAFDASILMKDKLISDVGVQLFSIPHMLEKDYEGALRMLSDLGYTKLELFGPYPFSATSAKEGWKAVTPQLGFSGSGFFGQDPKHLMELFKQYNMKVPAVHTDLDTLEQNMAELAAASEILGFEYVILPALPPENRSSMEEYKRTTDLFNKIGRDAEAHGLKFAYHNHGYGLGETEGQIPLQYLIENTDPKWLFLEMDLFWTTAGRAEPLEYLAKYPGRYKLMHVKDMKEKKFFSGDGGDPSQWIELFPIMCSAGEGVIELDKIIPRAIESGVEHFIVEQDMVQNPETALSTSINYLKSL